MSRLDDVKAFYRMMDELADRLGGPRRLSDCYGRDSWPERGVYFFFEDGELRTDSGDGLRVVRVGTHCVSKGSKTKLWKRLSQHRGTRNGGGNHRGSVFRLWVGDALNRMDPDMHADSWLDGGASVSSVKEAEYPLESKVSAYIGKMPFLWIAVDDHSSKDSKRAYIERNAIALLSNYAKLTQLDTPSKCWPGLHSSSEEVRMSGLWNSRHVDEAYDEEFLNELEHYILRTVCATGCESAQLRRRNDAAF